MSRRLAPVPEHPPRAVIYARVSQVGGRGEDLTSPELQEHAARDYCTRRGYVPVAVLVDLDKSGRSWSKRQVEQAVQMIERGDADVIVCWRYSRFTRNLRDYVIQTARIEAAGGRLEAALEETDPATAAGLMQRDLFAVLAQWESRVKSETWKETHARRRREGLAHTSYPRFGYLLGEGRRYEVDPGSAPLVVEAYHRYVAGDGGRQLADWLNRLGVPQPRFGGRWSPKTALRMLDSGFAAGLLRVDGDLYIEATHPALVDERLWRTYLRERERRREMPARLVMPAHPLSGLVRCPGCGRSMRLKRPKHRWQHGVKTDRPGSPMFACESYGCPAPVQVSAVRATRAVLDWLRPIVADKDVSAATLAADKAHRTVAKVDLRELRSQITRLEQRLQRARMDLNAGLLLPADFRATRDALAEMLREARRAEREAEAAADRPPPSRRVVKRLLDHWDEMTDVGRRRALADLVARVDVVPVPGERSLIRPLGTWEV